KRKGVAGKRVELIGADNIETKNEISNKNGMVSFEIVSDQAGQFKLTATVEGVPLNRGVTVTFR
ncbi:hypothetical protein DRH14_00215, partial [Candidatus Shapirobacteria bacterium]